MKIFFDTSILVPALVEQHADHARSFPLLQSVQSGKNEGIISAHSLAETYAILTRLPAPFRHSPAEALLSIEENILKHFETIALSGRDYAALLKAAALIRIQGGTIYDALLMKCAAQAGVGKIFTFNLKHFQAVASPDLLPLLSAP